MNLFNSSSDRNSFKELYFECTDVEYDEGNGRVTLMAFKAVAKRNRAKRKEKD